jgi:hypothetical protein
MPPLPLRPGLSVAARQAFWLSAALLSVDAAFGLLHVVWVLTKLLPNAFSIEAEHGVASLVQAAKTLVVAALLGAAARRHRLPGLAAWSALFAYVLLDDALGLHERAGAWLGGTDHRTPLLLGLRRADVGEAAFLLAVGAALLVPIAAFYVRGGPFFRRATLVLAGLLALAAFFGVALDFVHALASLTPLAGPIGLLEDLGEMAAMSLIAGYTFFLCRRRPHSARAAVWSGRASAS